MKAIIPVMDREANKMLVAEGFHTTDIMCVYNMDTEEKEWIDSSDLCQFSSNITEELEKRGVDSVITNEMAFMALGLFTDGGFSVWKSRGNDLLYNLNLFKNGELEPFLSNSAFKKNSCSSGSCSTCETTCDN